MTLAGTRPPTVDEWDKSDIISITMLRKIAMGFNMTVSELLDFPEMNEMESKTNERKYVR